MEDFDIFSGSLEREPLWLECVHGADKARERMKERARKTPGPYFIFCCQTHRVIESVDTSELTGDPAPHVV